jgi:probable F420-dependent oxidoreductase
MLDRRAIGFSVQANLADAATWAQLGRRAEDVGFEAICVGDHPGTTASPFVALAALAHSTSTIQLGTAVLNMGTWQPLTLAAEVATLHVLSGGRAYLGVGAGHTPAEWTATGRPFPSVAKRVEHMIEVVDATRALLGGGPVTLRTEHVWLEAAQMRWPPGPSPTIPLLVGGNGTGVLRYGARVADMVELTGLGRTLSDGHLHLPAWDPAAVDRRIARLTAEQDGRNVRVGALVQRVLVTDERLDLLRSFRDELAALMGNDVAPALSLLLETPYLLVGSESEIVQQLHSSRDRWGITRYTVRDSAIDAMAPIIDRLRSGASSRQGRDARSH